MAVVATQALHAATASRVNASISIKRHCGVCDGCQSLVSVCHAVTCQRDFACIAKKAFSSNATYRTSHRGYYPRKHQRRSLAPPLTSVKQSPDALRSFILVPTDRWIIEYGWTGWTVCFVWAGGQGRNPDPTGRARRTASEASPIALRTSHRFGNGGGMVT